MKLFFLLVVWVVGVAGFNANGAPLTPAEKTLQRVLDTGRVNADLTLIPPEQKADVIAILQRVASQKSGSVEIGNYAVHVMAADLLLLRLGDEFTMDRMVQDYRAYNSMSAWSYVQDKFELSRQPLLIPYLAEDLYLNEDPTKAVAIDPPPGSQEFGVAVPPRSIFSGITMVRIIQAAPEFSQEMKDWAKQAYQLRLASPQRFRTLMQRFWETNKAAFDRHDFASVEPVNEKDKGALKIQNDGLARDPGPGEKCYKREGNFLVLGSVGEKGEFVPDDPREVIDVSKGLPINMHHPFYQDSMEGSRQPPTFTKDQK